MTICSSSSPEEGPVEGLKYCRDDGFFEDDKRTLFVLGRRGDSEAASVKEAKDNVGRPGLTTMKVVRELEGAISR